MKVVWADRSCDLMRWRPKSSRQGLMAYLLVQSLAWLTMLPLAHGQSLDSGPQCDTAKLKGDAVDCTNNVCSLKGHAEIQCTKWRLKADTIRLQLDADRKIQDAQAEGNVEVIDNQSIIECKSIHLDSDRIRGKILGAKITIKKPPSKKRDPNAQWDPNKIRARANEAFVYGDVTRSAPNRFSIEPSTFTLCDCPNDKPDWNTTWDMHASKTKINLRERAVIYWPSVWVRFFGLRSIPITPPLLPLSIPLKKRALGLLPPELGAIGSLRPSIVQPFFVPLGRSFDVTLRPGFRFDWMGPSLGTRFRWAITKTHSGWLKAQWNYDPTHPNAREAEENGVSEEFVARLKTLKHRINIQVHELWQPNENINLLINARWINDDRYPGDLGVGAAELVADYFPSRLLFQWRPIGYGALVTADHLLRVGNDPNTLFNHTGFELSVPHRMPGIELQWLPTPLFSSRIHADAGLRMVHFGPWQRPSPLPEGVVEAPNNLSQSPVLRQLGVGAHTGLSYHQAFGPLEISLRTSGEAWLTYEEAPNQATRMGAWMNEGRLQSTWIGQFGPQIIHTISPSLVYRGQPVSFGSSPQEERWNARLRMPRSEQISLELHQILQNPSASQKLSLTVEQPFDLIQGDLLQTRLTAVFQTSWVGSGSIKTEIDWSAEGIQRLSRIELGWNYTTRFVDVGLNYMRARASSGQFHQSPFVLSASKEASASALSSDRPGAHNLAPRIALKWAGVRAGYSTGVLFRRPDEEDEFRRDCRIVSELDGTLLEERSRCVTGHVITLSYQSNCKCWGFSASAIKVPNEKVRFNILWTIGSYSLGT